MIAEHTLTVCAKCPVNGDHDVYEVTFRLDRFVRVEELLEAVSEYDNKTIFQEGLTQQLADRFRCKVVSKGSHRGVGTRVVCHHVNTGERDITTSENITEQGI